jgi:hypothetical protein
LFTNDLSPHCGSGRFGTSCHSRRIVSEFCNGVALSNWAKHRITRRRSMELSQPRRRSCGLPLDFPD